jgi:hypothetical protein
MRALHGKAYALPLALVLLAIVAIMACGLASAQTDPPSSGDWTVSDMTLVKDTDVELHGSLFVTATGRLTLENVTLRVFVNANGDDGIEVATGGQLTVRDGDGLKATTGDNSAITSQPTTNSLWFIVRAGATLRLTNTAITHCGYAAGPADHQGLYIYATGAVLRGVDVRDSLFGMLVDSGGVDAQGCSFTNCTYQGILASSSRLDITDCTIADCGYDGVRATGGTTVIDRSIIHHCRWGVMARTSAVVTVGNSSVHSNDEGIAAEQGFQAFVFNCSVESNTFYALHFEINGQVEVRGSTAGGSEKSALYAFTNVVVASSGSTYHSCTYGVRLNLNSRATCTGDTIKSNTNSGALVEQASVLTLVGSELRANSVGVSADTGTTVVAWATRVESSSFEAYKLTDATLQLHDGTVANSTSRVGIAPDSTSSATWTVHAGNSSALVNCDATLTADMQVAGSLVLRGATLTFRTSATQHPGLVCTGGAQRWENSTIEGSDQTYGFRLEVLASAVGEAWFLTVDGAGWSEAAPSSEGAHVGTAFAFHRCTFRNSLRGVVVTDGPVSFDRCVFAGDDLAIRVDGGQARFENCSVGTSTETGRLAGAAVVDLVNCSIDAAGFTYSDVQSQLRVHWIVHVEVSYPSGVRAAGARVTVEDSRPVEVADRVADAAGKVVNLLLTQAIISRDSREDRTPHSLTATLGGASSTQAVNVRAHATISITLTDSDMPVIAVVSHTDGDFLSSANLVLRGTATDPSSPVYDVMVRIASQPWEAAVGKESWTWSRQLPGDGSYPIYVRARDLALNEAILLLNLTLDTHAPRVYVESPPSPANGSTVGVDHVDLSGYVDDATARVSWGTVNATMQGSDYTVNVTLVHGENLITIVARDPAGNEGRVIWRLIAQLEAPPLRVDSPVDGRLYNTASVTLEGVTQPGAQVLYTVPDRTTSWYMVMVNALGSFSGALSELGEGRNEVVVVARSAVGNEARMTLVVYIDTVKPELLSVTPANGAYLNVRNALLAGTWSEPLQSLLVLGHAATLDGTNFTISVPLDEGSNSITMAATDAAGNIAYANMVLHLDTSTPKLTLNEPQKNASTGGYEPLYTNHREYRLTGTTEAGSTVSAADDVQTTNAQGQFSLSVQLEDGSNSVVVRVVDRAGNAFQETITLVLDTTPPELVVTSPEDRSRTSEAKVLVRGRVTPGDSVVIGSVHLTPVGGEFELEVALDSDIARILVVAVDLAGNEVQEPRLVFRVADTAGLTGYDILDRNCNVLMVVLLVLAGAFAAAAAVSGASEEEGASDERRLREILEEDTTRVGKPRPEPVPGSLDYAYDPLQSYTTATAAGAEEEDEEFVSMEDFKRQLEGGGAQ